MTYARVLYDFSKNLDDTFVGNLRRHNHMYFSEEMCLRILESVPEVAMRND